MVKGDLYRWDREAFFASYGQQWSRDCESTLDRVTNWLYLFLVPLASFNLLQYYTRLRGGVPRQSHSLGTQEILVGSLWVA